MPIDLLAQFEPHWAMEATRLRAWMLSQPKGAADLDASAMRARAEQTVDPTVRIGSVAVIPVLGALSKAPSQARLLGLEDRATLPELEVAVKQAAADRQVSAIVLLGDSPGGTVAGTADLADAVYAARSTKPVVMYARDCACSAMYWIGSQATRFYANKTADLANIGAMTVLFDVSKLMGEWGVDVKLIKSAEHKGLGVLGPEVTEAHVAEATRWIGKKHDQFVAAVARGRGMSTDAVAKVADGRVLVGDEAQAVGLIDGVMSFAAAVREAEQMARAGGTGVGGDQTNLNRAGHTTTAGTGPAHTTVGALTMNELQKRLLARLGFDAQAAGADADAFVAGLNADQAALYTQLAEDPGGSGDAGGQDPNAANPTTTTPTATDDPTAANPAPAPPSAPTSSAPAPLQASRPQIDGIAALVSKHDASFDADLFTAYHEVKGSTLEQVQQAAATQLEQVMKPKTQTISVGDDGREGFAQAVGDVLAGRMDVEVDKPHELTARLSSLSLVEVGRRFLAQLGVADAQYLSDERTAQLLIDRTELAMHLGGVALGHTTSDFPGILSNTATKTLVQGFDAEPTTYQAWARNEELANLHEYEEYAGGGVPLPSRIPERGPYELVTFAFKAEKKRVYKYGLKAGLSLEMVIQDRINAFAEQIMDFGGSSRELRNRLVYQELASNGLMNEDGAALFSAAHNNLNQGNAGAFNEARLSAMKTAMRQQKAVPPDENTEGRNIRITPTFLLGPTELEDDFDRHVASRVKIGGTNDEPNLQWLRNLTPITDPELSDDSATAFYLLGPRRKSPVKSLTLRGYATPTVQRLNKIENDTMEFQLRDFAGAARVEYRSAQKNDGA
ncbi:MAG: S49 family peptidase [Planctomycetota bacterium]